MQIRFSEFVTSVGNLHQLPTTGLPEIAFAGRSNVGKSSLLNRLLNRKSLAKISNSPGKTRTINFFRANNNLYLVDLPGYGYARRGHAERKAWGDLVNGYLEKREPLAGILQLVDARHDPTAQDIEMVDWLLHFQRPFLLVATKADKVSGSLLKIRMDRTRALFQERGEVNMLPFSATTGRGRDTVWQWIQEVLNG